MADERPSPPRPVWYSFRYAASLFQKPAPAVNLGEILKDVETRFLNMKKTGVDDREPTLRNGILLMSNGAARDRRKMQTVAMELLHFQGGESPTLGGRDPLPSTNSAEHEEVFNSLLEVRGERIIHPHNVSALVDGYLTLISLCVYQPDSEDTSKNRTTPYLDLSPLYGSTNTATEKIRVMDGRGTLHRDSFCEERVQLLPPVVSALLVLWNRNHNFIAHNLFIRFASIKRWQTDFEAEYYAREKQDEEIFNIARQINCMQFRNTVSEDILKGLIGLSPFDPSLGLDILEDITSRPKGGKMKTYKESNFLHTLSPMISQKDASMIEEKMREITGGEGMGKYDSSSFRKLHFAFAQNTNQDPMTCHYPGLRRDARTGQFKDEDLARIFVSAREELACAPTARNSPSSFKIFHLEALEDERNWKACTFNEFRKLYGLKPLPSFTAWNSDPDIVNAAEKLYGDIDRLGLYVGLQCEATSPSGFGLGYTKTYALIVDLVTRIRSEPAPEKLSLSGDNNDYFSTWIKREVSIDRSRPGNGSVLPKILQRNFPTFYLYDNANTYFLFCTPSSFNPEVIEIFRQSGLSFYKPPGHRIHTLSDITALQYVFNKPKIYRTLYAAGLSKVTEDYGYLLGFDVSEVLHSDDKLMTMYALIPDDGCLQRYGSRFAELTASAIKKHRKKNHINGTTTIDITGEVINEACTMWVCETLCNYKPEENNNISGEKAKSKPARGDAQINKTVKEMQKEFANLYTFIVGIFDPEDGYKTEKQAMQTSKYLRDHIETKIPKPAWLLSKSYKERAKQTIKSLYHSIHKLVLSYFRGIPISNKSISSQTFLERIVEASWIVPYPDDHREKHIRRKLGSDPNISQHKFDQAVYQTDLSRIAANIVCLAAITAFKISQACSLVVDLYLQEKYAAERKEIERLSKKVIGTEEDRLLINEQLAGYIHDALRISQPLTLWRCATENDTITMSNYLISVDAGDLIFADFRAMHNAANDPYERRIESLFGMGTHKCPAFSRHPGDSFIDQTVPEVIKVIFRLEGLSRIPGNPYSTLNRVQVHPDPSPMYPNVFAGLTGELEYCPQTLVLQYLDSRSDERDEKNPHEWDFFIARTVSATLQKTASIIVATSILITFIMICKFVVISIIGILGFGDSPNAAHQQPLATFVFDAEAREARITFFGSDNPLNSIRYFPLKPDNHWNITFEDAFHVLNETMRAAEQPISQAYDGGTATLNDAHGPIDHQASERNNDTDVHNQELSNSESSGTTHIETTVSSEVASNIFAPVTANEVTLQQATNNDQDAINERKDEEAYAELNEPLPDPEYNGPVHSGISAAALDVTMGDVSQETEGGPVTSPIIKSARNSPLDIEQDGGNTIIEKNARSNHRGPLARPHYEEPALHYHESSRTQSETDIVGTDRRYEAGPDLIPTAQETDNLSADSKPDEKVWDQQREPVQPAGRADAQDPLNRHEDVNMEDFVLTTSLYTTWSAPMVQKMEQLGQEVERHLRDKRAHDIMAQRARDEQRRVRQELVEKLAQAERELARIRNSLGLSQG